jgi:putative glutamine amidotransferase
MDKLSQPIIGITMPGRRDTGSLEIRGQYIEVIEKAHGLPLCLPSGRFDLRTLVGILDGLVLSGGGDIDPGAYGGCSHPSVYGLDPERDAFELELAKLALEHNIATLGICRGGQALCVANGGKLDTHIPETYGLLVPHRIELQQGQIQPVEHDVEIAPSSRLAIATGTTKMAVVSWHHQAIHTPPKGWQAVAFSADGVIEAIEYQGESWAIGLQWHPELSQESLGDKRIFEAFVHAARMRKLARTGMVKTIFHKMSSSISS